MVEEDNHSLEHHTSEEEIMQTNTEEIKIIDDIKEVRFEVLFDCITIENNDSCDNNI